MVMASMDARVSGLTAATPVAPFNLRAAGGAVVDPVDMARRRRRDRWRSDRSWLRVQRTTRLFIAIVLLLIFSLLIWLPPHGVPLGIWLAILGGAFGLPLLWTVADGWVCHRRLGRLTILLAEEG